MTPSKWSQIVIVHLSDLHFGKPHRFQPEITANGDRATDDGFPELRASLLQDVGARLNELYNLPRLTSKSISEGVRKPLPLRAIFALTGDLTESAARAEFDQANKLLEAIRTDTNFVPNLSADDIFIVPGNHDLIYDAPDAADRWGHYCDFYDEFAEGRTKKHLQPIKAKNPQGLTRIIDQSGDGLVVAEINSAAYVQKNSPDALRGQVDLTSITRLKAELEAIDPDALKRSVRVALIHHHPVVLPTLAEAARGYDAVVHAGQLLGLLKQFGFHIILHGHKHDAQSFPHDSVSAWSGTGSKPIMVVSGGSVGSTELPSNSGAKNTYNIISVKWHPPSGMARIRIETRGLNIFSSTNDKLLPHDWNWQELRVDDRLLKTGGGPFPSKAVSRQRSSADESLENARDQHLADVRRCWPVVEVVPSLHSDQAFEARVWIDGQPDKDGFELPETVEWNAGRWFSDIQVCHGAADVTFSARFSYFGPMAIQARMYWKDGHEALQYIFAHYPGAGSSLLQNQT